MINNKVLFLSVLLIAYCSLSAQSDTYVILSKDSTAYHYLFELKKAESKKDRTNIELVNNGCGHYEYYPKHPDSLLICPKHAVFTNFIINDTVVLSLHCKSLSTLNIDYVYIGLGDYLLQYPQMQLFIYDNYDNCDNSSRLESFLSNVKLINQIDSYLFYIWQLDNYDISKDVTCYADWFNAQMRKCSNVIINCSSLKTIPIYNQNMTITELLECETIEEVGLICTFNDKSLVYIKTKESIIVGLIDKSVLGNMR